MEEIWKQSQFDSRLEVSNLGRLRAKETQYILSTDINNNGYEFIKFRGKHFTIHRLVAREFCDGYKEGLVVNHIDANRLNNVYANLEWMTTKDNIHDMVKRGTLDTETARKHLKLEKEVIQMTLDGKEVATYSSLKEAGEHSKAHPSKISACAHGKRNTAAGYKWKFKNPHDLETFVTKK